VQALGHQLFVTDKGEQLVIGQRGQDGPPELLFIHESDGDDDLEEWIADREGPGTQHLDGIRLQAKRVVRAYRELRDDTASANFKSDAWPVGLFAELVQQIKLLEGWLEPAEKADDDELLKRQLEDRLTTDETTLVYSIQAVANAIYARDDGAVGLAMALKKLVDELASKL
jgi:hypothetical protein